MLFIVSSNAEKVNPATRKLIRSHAMRGKKQKKARPDDSKRKSYSATTAGRTRTASIKVEEVITKFAPLLPGRVGSDLSFVEFADEIEQSTALNMVKGS